MTFALEIKNFSKRYGSFLAVDDISLSVNPGEIFGLLGPNGAGKSTTISSICGINKFHEGQILVYGKDVQKESTEAKRLIGLSAQEFNVDPFINVEKTLNFMGGYYGIPKEERKRRIEELLDKLNLKPHAKKIFRNLSGGLMRRVVLAKALLNKPKLLILDEPTAALDVELRYELWDIIKKLNQDGTSIILTSHYIEEIDRLCNRVAIINKGKIGFIGNKSELRKDNKSLEEAYINFVKKS